MDSFELMRARHSVRQYHDRPLAPDVRSALTQFIAECNAESGLHIQLVTDEPKAFGGFMAHYGSFSGVSSYIALVGKKAPDLDEKCGWYGEKIVLKAQELGLNTCWVALTYSKVRSAYQVGRGEKLVIVISLGYGVTQGVEHKSKSAAEVSNLTDASPDWFRRGVEAALLAPTAVNQQRFTLEQNENVVSAKALKGVCSQIDLGIVKYHFALGAGKENFTWA